MAGLRLTALETVAWAAKIVFLSIGIFSSLSITAKLAYPHFITFISSASFHQLDSSALSTGPPYLFLTVNFIIILIWKLHHHTNNHHQSPSLISLDSAELLMNLSDSPSPSPDVQTVTSSDSAEIKKCIHDDDDGMREYTSSGAVEIKKRIDHHQPWPPPLSDTDEGVKEKDLDATWTAIMNSRSSPAKNQVIKKSDTWEKSAKQVVPALARAGGPPVKESREFVKSDTFGGRSQDEEDGLQKKKKKEMRKSKTFRESIRESSSSSSSSSSSVGWRGRDVLVVSHDELFKKVEAFIKMNYDQMKLQRKESEQRRRGCVEMLNAAAY